MSVVRLRLSSSLSSPFARVGRMCCSIRAGITTNLHGVYDVAWSVSREMLLLFDPRGQVQRTSSVSRVTVEDFATRRDAPRCAPKDSRGKRPSVEARGRQLATTSGTPRGAGRGGAERGGVKGGGKRSGEQVL